VRYNKPWLDRDDVATVGHHSAGKGVHLRFLRERAGVVVGQPNLRSGFASSCSDGSQDSAICSH